jgi:hypothetical protein
VLSEIGYPPPQAGYLVRFLRFGLDPARDESSGFFISDILPSICRSPGFRGVRNFTDVRTGRGLTAIIVRPTKTD